MSVVDLTFVGATAYVPRQGSRLNLSWFPGTPLEGDIYGAQTLAGSYSLEKRLTGELYGWQDIGGSYTTGFTLRRRWGIPLGAPRASLKAAAARHEDAAPAGDSTIIVYGVPAPATAADHLAWGQPEEREQGAEVAWEKPTPATSADLIAWEIPLPVGDFRYLNFDDPTDSQAVVIAAFGSDAEHRTGAIGIPVDDLDSRAAGKAADYGRGAPAAGMIDFHWAGGTISKPHVIPIRHPEVGEVGFSVTVDFYFQRRRTFQIDAVERAANYDRFMPLDFDFRWYYRGPMMIEHTASVETYPAGVPIKAESASVSLSRGDFTWTLNMVIDATQEALVAPTSLGVKELKLTLDGWIWVFVVESSSRQVSFGKTQVALKGRSLAAYLGKPYASAASITEGNERLAAQLADQEATPLDFTVAWNIVDWIVPANAYTYTTQTPIESITRIASAAGGIVVPSRNSMAVAVDYAHPVPSWGWSAAPTSKTITPAIITQMTTTFRQEEVSNKVYVFGGPIGGVGAGVKRAGTDGSKPLPTIIEPIITAANAATEKGRQALSATGSRIDYSIEIPLFPATNPIGLIEPGEIVLLHGEGKAFVTRNSIAASWSESLSIRQQLTLEATV